MKPRMAVWVAAALLVIAVVGTALHAQRYSGMVIDDAFITYRHTWNLVHGNGYTCNAGERVEGTSTALFALLLVPFMAIGADPYRCAVLTGTLAWAMTCILAYLSVRSCVADTSARYFALGGATLVAASSPLAYHSQTGMETTMFAALIMGAFYLHLRSVMRRDASPAWAMVMGLAALTRTEATGYFLIWLVLSLVVEQPGFRTLARAGRTVSRFCVVFLPLVVLRLAYFGQVVPNSVIAKSGRFIGVVANPSYDRLASIIHGDGTTLLISYLRQHSLLAGLAVGCLLIGRAGYALLLASALMIGGALVMNWSNGDWMLHDRHLTPSIAPLAVCAVLGVRGLLFHDEQRSRSLGHVASLGLVTLAACPIVRAEAHKLDVPERARWSIAPLQRLGNRLATVTDESELVVSDTAGILPYFWRARVIDTDGLCNVHIADNGRPQPFGTGRTLPEYVMSLRPTWYAFRSWRDAVDFWQQPAFAPHRNDYFILQYPAQSLQQGSEEHRLPTILVRKDRPQVQRIPGALGVTLVDSALLP